MPTVLRAGSTAHSRPQLRTIYLTMCLQRRRCPDCSRHLESAVRFYDQALYPEALAEYQAAYRLQSYPLIVFNIARLHHKQSHLSEAIVYYQRYLDTAHADRAERAALLLAEAQREQASAAASAEPAPPVPAVPAPGPPPAQVPAVAVASTRHVNQEHVMDNRPIYKQWWLWTLVGATAAGVATAVALGVYARGPDTAGLQAKTLSFGN